MNAGGMHRTLEKDKNLNIQYISVFFRESASESERELFR